MLEASRDVQLRINGGWQTLRFDRVTVDGATVTTNVIDPAHEAWRLAIAHFRSPTSASTRVAIHYTVAKVRDAFALAVKRDVAVAINDAVWYPVPPDGSMAVPPGRVTFRMPAGCHAASMGTLEASREEGGQQVEIFSMAANRRRAFIAAPYRIHAMRTPTGTNTLYLLDAPIDDQALLSAFDLARRGLEERYGPMPFHDYRIAEMPDDAVPWYGASEEGLIISRTTMMQSVDGLIGNLVHELAHAWWGNAVAPEGPGSPMINEGMASFSAMAFFESRQGRARVIEASEFGSATGSPDATIYGYVQLWRSGRDVPLSRLKPGVGDDYNIAQTKGVWVLRMVHDRIGDEAFYGVLRRLASSSPTLSLAALRQAFIEAVPADRTLPGFLAQWCDQRGLPVLAVHWRNSGTEDRRVATISVFQQQAGGLYSLHVDLKLRTRKGVMTTGMDLDGVETHEDVSVPDDVVGIEVDPDHKLLLWRPEFGQAPVLSN